MTFMASRLILRLNPSSSPGHLVDVLITQARIMSSTIAAAGEREVRMRDAIEKQFQPAHLEVRLQR
jgi:hypothetical protein